MIPQISYQKAVFKDRRDAGKQLAKKLLIYKKYNPVILALPRGGVVIGYEIAKQLKDLLEVLVVRKLGSPYNTEFAIGAITEDEIIFLDEATIQALGIPNQIVRQLVNAETKELNRRVEIYRGNKKIMALKNKVVIVVDDGLATGATAMVAIKYTSKQNPKEIIFAAPVCAYESLEKLKPFVSKTVSILTPKELTSISNYYEYFPQTSDEDVINLIQKQ